MNDMEQLLRTHPFCRGLAEEHLATLVGCTTNMRFRAGEYLLREGESEDKLYLLRQGRVGLELRQAGGESVCLETLSGGDVLGVSLLTPHAAHLDCRAQETVLALGIDNGCLIQKMNADPRLGYAISMRLLENTYQRLSRHRLQSLDVYR